MNGSAAEVSLDVFCDACGGEFKYPLANESFVCPHCGQVFSRAQAIEAFLRTTMAKSFSYDRRMIKPSSRLNEIGDSMGTIELLMRLEQEFGISIEHDDIDELETVAQVTNYICQKVSRALQQPAS
jgi:acyl carrier protein